MRRIPKINTLVIKVGSSILSGDDNGLNLNHISNICFHIANLKKIIPNIIIVSSGAVASGFKLLGFNKRPKDIVSKQACAAAGQARLIWIYAQEFEKWDIKVAQVLLTKDDLSNRKRYLHASSALKKLLELNAIPIINENDTILVDELKYIESFGDNDNLGALVACITEAELLLILSDVNGLYTDNPQTNKNATIIHNIEYIDNNILKVAGGSISNVGTGGMHSKLLAAQKALATGCEVAIIKGTEPENITKFFNGELIGSYFFHPSGSMKRKKFWIGYAAIPRGKITIDNGAYSALLSNKSLLSSGVIKVEGRFITGDIVRIFNIAGLEVARGKIRYPYSDMQKIKSKNSSEIRDIIGYKISDEIIHKDDLVILEDNHD